MWLSLAVDASPDVEVSLAELSCGDDDPVRAGVSPDNDVSNDGFGAFEADVAFALFDVGAPFDAVGPFDDGIFSDASTTFETFAVAGCCTLSDVGGFFDVSAVLAASATFDACERSGNDVPVGAGISFEERASVDDRTSDPEAEA